MAGAAADLDRLLGHRFARPDLLTQALTHPSVTQSRRHSGSAPYERLEFLGDRVLGLVVADMLFQRFPDEAEGALARRFTGLVRREAVARVALAIGLQYRLNLAKGEEEAGGRANQGQPGEPGSFEPSGVYVGLVGARFEKDVCLFYTVAGPNLGKERR